MKGPDVQVIGDDNGSEQSKMIIMQIWDEISF